MILRSSVPDISCVGGSEIIQLIYKSFDCRKRVLDDITNIERIRTFHRFREVNFL